ncbi:MAG: hypothetical protein FNP40_16455 [Dehalobacter sp. 4CP]|nr:hypothetical protein [Dehalobacter sp. 4CP]
MSLSSFLEFWKNPVPHAQQDPVKSLYNAYVRTAQELAARKAKGILFLVPGKDSRGRWIPVYDEGKINDVAALSGEIEQTAAKLKSISNDIEEVQTLAGGHYMLELQREHEQLIHSVQLAESVASAMMRRAINARGRTTQPLRPEEFATRPEIVEAYAKADLHKAESAPKIEEMAGRLEKIRAILEKYA